MRFIVRLSCAAVLLLIALTSSFAAEGYDAATRAAIQDVISKQLDALAHEDGAKAQTFASTAIQKKFPAPGEFFEMVKKNYAALMHPKRTHFDEMASSPHGQFQKMTVVAADGTIWTAIYSLEQADGGWRITGCRLEKLEGQQDI